MKYENLTGWGYLLANLKGFLSSRWGEYRKKVDQKFWEAFDDKAAFIRK